MSSKFKVSEEAKTISWKDRAEYIVISTNTDATSSEHLPFGITILSAQKGSWKSNPFLPTKHDLSYDKIVEIKESGGKRHVLTPPNKVIVFDEQTNSNSKTITGHIDTHHTFDFDTVVIPSWYSMYLTTTPYPHDDVLSTLPSAREDMIENFDDGFVEEGGQQYKITTDEDTFYIEESADTKIIAEISYELNEAVANEVREELETWLDDKELWKPKYLKDDELTLDEIMSKMPVYDKITKVHKRGNDIPAQIARDKWGKGSGDFYVSDTATDPEAKVATLHSKGFTIDYVSKSSGRLHWDSKQETWVIKISTSMKFHQLYSLSYVAWDYQGKQGEKKETKHRLLISVKDNIRLIPLSFDYRDGNRSMVKELAALGDFSKLTVTGPDGKAAPGINYTNHCYVFELKDLDKEPEWLKDIIDLNPQARSSKSKPVSQDKPISAASPPSVQQHRTVSPQNHIGGNSEFNWQIVETLQRIAEAVERIADKDDS